MGPNADRTILQGCSFIWFGIFWICSIIGLGYGLYVLFSNPPYLVPYPLYPLILITVFSVYVVCLFRLLRNWFNEWPKITTVCFIGAILVADASMLMTFSSSTLFPNASVPIAYVVVIVSLALLHLVSLVIAAISIKKH